VLRHIDGVERRGDAELYRAVMPQPVPALCRTTFDVALGLFAVHEAAVNEAFSIASCGSAGY
jgi:hypothetical protein